MKATRVLVPMLVLLLAWAEGVRAQDAEVLYWTFNPRVNRPIEAALADMSIPAVVTFSEGAFFFQYDSQPWKLVIIRRKDVLSFDTQVRLIDRLEDHLARGGRVLVHLAEIERMPMLQGFLGLDGADDIVTREVARPLRDPSHPAGRFLLRGSGAPPPDELGSSLLPNAESKPFVAFDDGTIASILVREGQIIVNGWEPDGWSSADGRGMAGDNLNWLLGCPADLDGSGSLDLFDFLEFQRLFDAGDPSADWFCYDGRLDVFDFLAFFNAFEAGCP